MYLGGLEFSLVTDHKPLEVIYGKYSKPSARIERWVLHLQPYNFRVVYRSGRDNIADALSRLSQQQGPPPKCEAEEYVRFIAKQAVPQAISIQEIEKESDKDPDLEAIRQAVQSVDWSKCGDSIKVVKDEITTVGKVVLRGTRIIIPKALQQKTILAAHEGHRCIVKTKARLRAKVWFPLMDKMAEQLCRSCHECQLVSASPNPETVKRTVLPDGPWQYLAADLLGPLPTGDYLFVVVDYFSRFFEVRFVKATTSARIIDCLQDVFAVHGFPVALKTDNAPNFTSAEFEEYLRDCGIRHHTSIPLWPQSNGEVERQNRTLLKYLKIVHSQGQNIQTELHKFLLAYRTTPHSTTGMAPAEMLFRRKIRTKLPEVQITGSVEDTSDFDFEAVQVRDGEMKEKGKQYIDKKRSAESSGIKSGDKVLVKQQQRSKLDLPFHPSIHTVIKRDGHEVVVRSEEGKIYRRDIAHVKKYCEPPSTELEGDSVKSESQLDTSNEETIPGNKDERQQVSSRQSGEQSTGVAVTAEETSDVTSGGSNDITTRFGRLSRKPDISD